MQFKCNTGAKSVTPVQITNRYVILVMIGKRTMRNFVGQWYLVKQWQKLCTETLKKRFLAWEKRKASRSVSRHFFRVNFFMFLLSISNITVFLFQFEIIWSCEFLKMLNLLSPKRLVQFQLFEKLTRAY